MYLWLVDYEEAKTYTKVSREKVAVLAYYLVGSILFPLFTSTAMNYGGDLLDLLGVSGPVERLNKTVRLAGELVGPVCDEGEWKPDFYGHTHWYPSALTKGRAHNQPVLTPRCVD